MANHNLPPAVINRLHRELREILTNPDACIHVFLPNDDNLLVWKVAIFGPPDSVYQGGYFPAEIRFPNNYPFSPPSFKFLRSPWHTNIAENGGVCISTLKAEQWNAVHSVRTILLSIVSLLTDPNVNSALNPTANSEYVRWRNNQGNQFADRVRREVEASRADAERDGVVVPQTHEEYLRRSEELNAAVEAARQAANVQAAQDENASDALTAEIEADTQPAEESDDETDENGERTQENDEGTDEDDCQLTTCTSSL